MIEIRLELRRLEAALPLVFVNFQNQELQLLLDLPLELVEDDPNTLLFGVVVRQPLVVGVALQRSAEAELVRPFGGCLEGCHCLTLLPLIECVINRPRERLLGTLILTWQFGTADSAKYRNK